MNDSVAIITVNYQNYPVTEEFLSYFRDQTSSRYTILIADLSKNKKSINETKFIRVLKGKNKGYAYGVNIGLRYAMEKGFDKFIVINNDVRVEKNFVEVSLASFKNNPRSIIGGKILYEKGCEYHDKYNENDKGKVIWYAGGSVDWDHALVTHRGVDEVDKAQFDNTEKTGFISGCLMLFDDTVIKKIGYWDESYFLYYEDADFSVKASRHGIPLIYDPSIRIWHKVSQSTGGSGSKIHQKYQRINRLRFALKYAPMRTTLHILKNIIFQKKK
jgi:GT2 family glycosyltransferase